MEKKKSNTYLIISIIFFALFLIFAICVWKIDRAPIGPNDSIVGFSKLNKWFSDLVGCKMTLYTITDLVSILPIATALIYATIGIVQWIKRKSIKNVDDDILVLGAFYVVLFIIYFMFNYIVINYRPVLINGKLEPSFPSSTTLLSITFMMLSIYESNRLLKSKTTKTVVNIISIVIMAFLVIGRVISGVHWLSDIIASILLSVAILFMYYFICERLNNKNHQ